MKTVLGSEYGTTWDYCWSVVWWKYLEDLWEQVEVYASEKPNEQTTYLFEKAEMELPEVLKEWSAEWDLVLVNHNTREGSISSIIDVHAPTISLSYSPSISIEPVWSTCTLIAEKFIDKVYIPELNYIILLLAGIIVDTENFGSENTTQRDQDAYTWLKEMVKFEDQDQFITELLAKAT